MALRKAQTPEKDILDLVRELGPERLKSIASASSPNPIEGFGELASATWKGGWQGKTMVALAGVGTVTSLTVLIEGLGTITGIDQLRIIRKFAEWYAA